MREKKKRKNQRKSPEITTKQVIKWQKIYISISNYFEYKWT